MKKLFLVGMIGLCWVHLQSQEKFSRPLYGNMQSINMIAHITDPDSLYEAQDYEYYQSMYKKANNQRILSLAGTVIGGGLATYGVILMRRSFIEETTGNEFEKGLGLTITGTVFFVAGISISIKSAQKMRQAKRAMKTFEKDVALSIGITDNGVGLVLKF